LNLFIVIVMGLTFFIVMVNDKLEIN